MPAETDFRETGNWKYATPSHRWEKQRRCRLVLLSFPYIVPLYTTPGTMAAAATTSLPVEIGGERNGDYRFTWMRDAAFTLKAHAPELSVK